MLAVDSVGITYFPALSQQLSTLPLPVMHLLVALFQAAEIVRRAYYCLRQLLTQLLVAQIQNLP